MERCDPGGVDLFDVIAPGFAPAALGSDRGDSSFTITLIRGATVRGRLSRNGKPLAHAPVELLRVGNDRVQKVLDGHVTTDAKGRYSFPFVTPGLRYSVFTPLPSFQEFGVSRTVEVIAGRDGSTVEAPEIQVTNGRTLKGRIVMPAGVSLAGRGLRLRAVRAIGFEGWGVGDIEAIHARVDSSGAFEFPGIPDELVWIVPEMQGYTLAEILKPPLVYSQDVGQGARITVNGDIGDLELPMRQVVPERELRAR